MAVRGEEECLPRLGEEIDKLRVVPGRYRGEAGVGRGDKGAESGLEKLP